MTTKKIISVFVFSMIAACFFAVHSAHAAVVIAQQLDDSLTGSTHTNCDNRCSDITVGSQIFTAAISGNLGSLEVFTSNFGTNSRYPEGNSCYMKIYDQDSGALLATSDNQFSGYGCGGDLSFIFQNSQPFMRAGKHYRWDYVFGAQNFSSITFMGGPNDTVGGSFNVAPLGGAEFIAFAAIMPPEFLSQLLPAGSTASASTITFAATLPAPLPDSLRLEVELEPSYDPFKNEPNLIGDFTSSDSSAQIVSSQLLNGGYHWQARAADSAGNASVWQTFASSNASEVSNTNADIYIEEPSHGIMLQDDTTPYHLNTQPYPCFGDGTIFSCALSPSFINYQVGTPFAISRITFDWNNNGANNCDNAGNYGAIITDGNTAGSTIIATSTNTVYLGCTYLGGTTNNAELDFESSSTIPSNFNFTLSAFDGILQGGSNVSVSNVIIYGTPIASSTSPIIVTTSTPRDPVVIVPGILGSTLNRVSDGKQIWPDANAMIFSGSDSYLDDLKLSSDGEQIPGMEMNPSDIVRTVTTSIPFAELDFYKPLIDSFTAAGYREGTDLFVAPYDWRLSIASSAALLAPVVQNAIAHSPDGKIDIVAHSMGGLVTKDYLSQLSEASSSIINKLILVGTPQLGAPEIFKALEYGDDLGFHIGSFELLAPEEVKSITQNMPGAYALLPSRRYIQTQGGYVIDNRSGAHTALDFDHTNEFLMSNASENVDDNNSDSSYNDKRNSMLLASADTFHATQDYAAASAPSVYNIVGCQNPATISSFVINDDGNADIVHGAGDGTVPIGSAMNLANGYQTYFSLYSENGADHTGLISNAKPIALIDAILENTTSSLALAPLGISTSTQDCLFGRSPAAHNETTIEVSTHSPITLNAYDAQNRHTGPTKNNSTDNDASSAIDLQIPGSSYETIGENSFLLLPALSSTENTYRIVGNAQATGTFTMKIKSLDDAANILGGVTYVQVPLASTSSIATLTISNTNFTLGADSSSTPKLTLDNYGDGASITTLEPTALLSASSSADITPPSIIMPVIPETVAIGTPITFDFSAVDDLSGIATTSALLDNIAITSGTIINDLSEGLHTIKVEVVDNAGNPSIETATFIIASNVTNSTSTNENEDGSENQNNTSTTIFEGGGTNSVVQVPSSITITTNSTPIKRQCKKKPIL